MRGIKAKLIVGTLATLITAAGLFAIAAPAQAAANTSSCTLRPWFWQPQGTECWTASMPPSLANRIYIEMDELWGYRGVTGWELIDTDLNVRVGQGGCYQCSTYITGLYGHYRLHMWGMGGTGTIHN